MYKLINVSRKYLEKEENDLIPKSEYTIDYKLNDTKCLLIFKSTNNTLTKHLKLCKDEHDLIRICGNENIEYEHKRGTNVI